MTVRTSAYVLAWRGPEWLKSGLLGPRRAAHHVIPMDLWTLTYITMFDFQRLRHTQDTTSAPFLAASIFVDISNVFLLFPSIVLGREEVERSWAASTRSWPDTTASGSGKTT